MKLFLLKMDEAKKRLITITAIVVLSIAVIVLSILLYKLSRGFRSDQNSQKNSQSGLSQKDKIEKGMLEYFISEVLIMYPDFQNSISSMNVSRVFPVGVGSEAGWVVEAKKDGLYPFYYIVTPWIQKELVNPTGSLNDPGGDWCFVESALTVGHEPNLEQNYREKGGYLLLSGECKGYGGGRVVSVYGINTAKKIKLQGNFGISEYGNALGKLRGVYGMNNPTLVVEYGSFESARNKLEEIEVVAYFDLQSGVLKQLVRFK